MFRDLEDDEEARAALDEWLREKPDASIALPVPYNHCRRRDPGGGLGFMFMLLNVVSLDARPRDGRRWVRHSHAHCRIGSSAGRRYADHSRRDSGAGSPCFGCRKVTAGADTRPYVRAHRRRPGAHGPLPSSLARRTAIFRSRGIRGANLTQGLTRWR
jgi:hypothetical protein